MDKSLAILIGFLPNPRMNKRIQVEKTMGDLHVICWDRGHNMLQIPDEDGYHLHIIRYEAGNDPVRRMIPYARFMKDSFALLKRIRPRLIHVQALDMLKIAAKYKKTVDPSTAIIYEVADLHRLIVDDQKNVLRKMIRRYLISEDRRLEQAYDKLLITSEAFYSNYFSSFVKKDKVLYIPNVPDLSVFANYKRKQEGPFTVGFIGSIRYKQQMRNLIEAANRTDIHLMIAGYEEEPIEIETICQGNNHIEWIGRFDFTAQIAELYGKCDAIYSVYDADMSNVRVALPNKLYESVYCELPIIVAKGTYLEKTVMDWRVGISVDHTSIEDLVSKLHDLQKDQAMYDHLSYECKKLKKQVDLATYNKELKINITQMLQEG